MSKQLQQNQTDIYQRLTVYDGQITNLTLQVCFIFIIHDTRLLENYKCFDNLLIALKLIVILLLYWLQKVLNILYFTTYHSN
jgi:hypothetical protein